MSQDEIGRASLGVPGLSVEVPITRRLIERLQRPFRKTPLKESIRVAGANVEIHVFEVDGGRATIYLSVASFFHRSVLLEDVRIQSFSVNHFGLVDISESAGPEFPLEPQQITRVHLQVALRASAVRSLLTTLKPAPTPLSTPEAYTSLAGTLICSSGRHRARVGFDLEPIQPKLMFARDFSSQCVPQPGNSQG